MGTGPSPHVPRPRHSTLPCHGRCTAEAGWLSAPSRGGTQGFRNLRETLKRPKPTRPPPPRAAPEPGCPSTRNAEGTHLCPLPDRRHLGAERPGCPENNPKPLGTGCWVLAVASAPTHHACSPASCLLPNSEPGQAAWELRLGPAVLWRHLVDTCSNSNTQVFLPSVARLTPGLLWPWAICW